MKIRLFVLTFAFILMKSINMNQLKTSTENQWFSTKNLGQSAVIAGIAYFIAIFATPWGWIKDLIIIGDAQTTFANITTQEPLFRMAIVCWFIVIVADIIVGWALYHFFLPVHRSVSLLAMSLRFIFAPIMFMAVFQWIYALQIITVPVSWIGTLDDVKNQALFYFTSYEYAVTIAFMVFGLHVGLIGYLAWKSSYVPKMIGILLMIAGVGYQIDAYATFLSAEYNAFQTGFLYTVAIPAFFSEFGFMLWLLIKGRKLKVVG